jgi:allophanate hydrolase subunit 2
MARFVSGPRYGRQDIGFSPAGAMDLFAMRTGNLLLGNPMDAESLEIALLPPRIEFRETMMFVLTGAPCEAVLITRDGRVSLDHATVYLAEKHNLLMFGDIRYGFRTYFCCREGADPAVIGRVRPPFPEIARWPDPDRRIRVLRGPEYPFLQNPAQFLENRWAISPQSNDIGIRLEGPPLTCDLPGMVSAPVSDGAVQLSPSGPIVLLKNRPTIGGYPRIFNVISADVDLLAQYGPGHTLHFLEVGLPEALSIARQKQDDLDLFLKKLG